jgi:hypothetical protein
MGPWIHETMLADTAQPITPLLDAGRRAGRCLLVPVR